RAPRPGRRSSTRGAPLSPCGRRTIAATWHVIVLARVSKMQYPGKHFSNPPVGESRSRDTRRSFLVDVKKTVTDAGYIAIGLGVMGYQQAQTRRRDLTGKLDAATTKVTDRGREVQGFVAEGTRQVGARGSAAKGRAEDQVRSTVEKLQEFGNEVAKRVEPVVDQVQGQLGQVPERVVQVIEPVTARVREITGSAA